MRKVDVMERFEGKGFVLLRELINQYDRHGAGKRRDEPGQISVIREAVDTLDACERTFAGALGHQDLTRSTDSERREWTLAVLRTTTVLGDVQTVSDALTQLDSTNWVTKLNAWKNIKAFGSGFASVVQNVLKHLIAGLQFVLAALGAVLYLRDWKLKYEIDLGTTSKVKVGLEFTYDITKGIPAVFSSGGQPSAGQPAPAVPGGPTP